MPPSLGRACMLLSLMVDTGETPKVFFLEYCSETVDLSVGLKPTYVREIYGVRVILQHDTYITIMT